MILNEKIKIKINPRNIKHYEKLGYENLKVGEDVEVSTTELMKGSHKIIHCQCYECQKINSIAYKDYNKNIKKYGYYTCVGKCSTIKNIKTNQEKYKCDFGNQNDNIKQKIKKTKLEKYNDEYYLNKDKYKETMMKKYGVEYPSQNKEFLEKMKNTTLENYGVEYYTQTDEYKLNLKNNNMKLYDVEFTLQRKEVKLKSIETNKIRYGVENPMQNLEIFLKQQKSGRLIKYYKNTNIHYQGTYELNFLNKYYDKIKILNGPTIKYFFDNKITNYFSDFYLPEYNIIVEIKSDYYFNLNKEKNLIKQKFCIDQGYNFIFIINKNYEEFEKYL